ncbi:hypothetical protein Tco_0582809 [Tanacetum coccineum]
MENEHELTYETLTRVYLGSYKHYKSVEAEVENLEPGFELQGAKMVEMGRFRLKWWMVLLLVTAVLDKKGGDVAQFGAKEGKIFVVEAE